MPLATTTPMRVGILLLCAGCSSVVTAQHSGHPTGPCEIDNVTGTLQGVSISIRANECSLLRGQAAHFDYTVTVDASVPAIAMPASAGCGACQKRTTDPSSWVRWGIGGTADVGTSQSYCICDTGCCPPDAAQTIQPAAAIVTGAIDWDGRTWYGPSDTDMPEGDFFLTGSYAVHVTFNGYDSGNVDAALPIDVYE